ncbi:MAG: thioredoxin-disulfide reductase [Lactobacillus sp.]|nr:thioredoxin-disulfide reductase [Lactobacillus sp.]
MSRKKYDVIVIGAGPGGMTAALYAARANLKVLMLDRGPVGGQMNNTDMVDNYPGYVGVKGPELAQKMYETLKQFDHDYQYGDVQSVTLEGDKKIVKTSKDEFETTALVIATGADHRKLGVPGEDDYSGRGVSYCAVCDGPFFKNKKIAVIGGGDSAVEESVYLASLAEHVTIVHRRDQLRAQPSLQKQAFDRDNISFVWNANTLAIEGDGQKVTGIKYLDKESNEEKQLDADAVFIYVGMIPQTAPFKDLPILDEHGWIVTNEAMETKVPGIFALGDVRQKDLRQISNAVGDGSIAGQNAYKYLQEH